MLEMEGLLNIAVCRAAADTAHRTLGELLAEAVQAQPPARPKREPGAGTDQRTAGPGAAWCADAAPEHVVPDGVLPDIEGMLGDEARARVEVCSLPQRPAPDLPESAGSRCESQRLSGLAVCITCHWYPWHVCL
jgi:hypothetical protein